MRRLFLLFLLFVTLFSGQVVYAQEESTSLPICSDANFRKEIIKMAKVKAYCQKPKFTCGDANSAKDEVLAASKLQTVDSDSGEVNSVTNSKVLFDQFLSQLNTEGVDDFCQKQDSLYEEMKPNTEQFQQYLKNEQGSDFCVALGNLEGDSVCPKVDNADKSFKELEDAIARLELVSILEEPIGRENLFTRARICKTGFVRDPSGNLQRSGDRSENNASSLDGKYRIEIYECESYIVPSCSPTEVNISSLYVKNEQIYLEENSTTALDYLPYLTYCDKVQVLYGANGIDLLKSYVGFIYRWAAGFIGVISVIVIMVSGIQISAANGDSGQVDEAKTRIIQTLSALALLFGSGFILYLVNPNFFTDRDVQKAQIEARDKKIQEEAAVNQNESTN